MSPEAYIEMAETENRHWWFAGRRLLLRKLISGLNLPAQANILEVGCGTGGNLEMLSAFGRVSALEMNETARSIAIEKTGGRIDIRAASCPENIPRFNEKFDLVCLFDVLEHIDEDVPTLTVLKGLLNERGRILLTVPAYAWLWSRHDEFLHHKRRYTADILREKAAAAGLHSARLSYFNTLLFPLAVAVRLKDRMAGRDSGTSVPPAPINIVLREIFGAERFLLHRLLLPFGVSLYAVLHR